MQVSRCRIGIDVGGTFTDFVLADLSTDRLTRFKQPSVPSDPSLSVERGLPPLLERAGVGAADVELIVHGTTLLVNAIIQRRGARVGLVVSRGNRGILEIGRARLANTYDTKIQKEEPLVPRDLILETSARTKADGTIIGQPEMAELEAIARRFREAEIEAATVLLLHSYVHPQQESDVALRLRDLLPGIPITESARIWPERREFERSLVALMNAYVHPLMDRYLTRLTERVSALGFTAPIYITASNGGTLSVNTARERPIDTILSGPASGVVAAARAAAGSPHTRLMTIDMGGTSCDVAVTEGGEPDYTTLTHVGDFPLILPVVAVSAIGAGGGSIVRVDAQGIIKVGPRSAGGDPGPVCYGLGGTEPTVTDCYLVMGVLQPNRFLGGRIQLNRDAAEAALANIADRLGITGANRATRAAEAALQVTTAMMSTELYKTMAQRGQDPRDFALMTFGGAGPTHGVLLAEEARLSTVIVPPAPATFFALGAILADVKRDYVRSRHLRLSEAMAPATLRDVFAELEREAAEWIRNEGDLLGTPTFRATCDMRYAGQAFDLPVEVEETLRRAPDAGALAEGLHRAHEKIYGFRDPDSGVEITTVRIRVIGQMPPISLPEMPAHDGRGPEPFEHRPVFHQGHFIEVPVYSRAALNARQRFVGPAIVEQEDCTIWMIPGWGAETHNSGNLVLTRTR